MAHVKCSCGKVMSDNSDNLYYKVRYIPDCYWNDFWIKIDDAIEKTDNDPKSKEAACMSLRYLKYFRSMFQCPDCGCLFIDDKEGKIHRFKPEPENDKYLFDWVFKVPKDKRHPDE